MRRSSLRLSNLAAQALSEKWIISILDIDVMNIRLRHRVLESDPHFLYQPGRRATRRYGTDQVKSEALINQIPL